MIALRDADIERTRIHCQLATPGRSTDRLWTCLCYSLAARSEHPQFIVETTARGGTAWMSSADPLEAVHITNILRCMYSCMGYILFFRERREQQVLGNQGSGKGWSQEDKEVRERWLLAGPSLCVLNAFLSDKEKKQTVFSKALWLLKNQKRTRGRGMAVGGCSLTGRTSRKEPFKGLGSETPSG